MSESHSLIIMFDTCFRNMLNYFQGISGRDTAELWHVHSKDNIPGALHLGCFGIENNAMKLCVAIKEVKLESFSSDTVNSIRKFMHQNSKCIPSRAVAV